MIDALHLSAQAALSLSPLVADAPARAANTVSPAASQGESGAFSSAPAAGVFRGDGVRPSFTLAPADFAQVFASASVPAHVALDSAAASYTRATLLTASSLQLFA